MPVRTLLEYASGLFPIVACALWRTPRSEAGTMLPRVSLIPFAELPATALLLLATACGDAVSPERRAPGADEVSQLAAPGDTNRITGVGSLGTGPAAPGGARQDFDFDVGSSLAGRVLFRDWSVIRADGSVGKLTVDPADAATRISAFRNASTICADATRGVELDGVGRVNTGGDGNPAGDELLAFTLRACDDGPAGSGMDVISIEVPGHGYTAGPDRLSSGDIVKSSGSAPPPPPPPGTGNLTVTTSTTGSGIPPGYTLSVSGPGGSATQPIGANETVTFSAITSGDYAVTLDAVPGNCTLSGGASRTVTVPAGGTGTVSYSVTCTTTTNSAPVVNAGPDQTALTGLLYSFSWSFTDANHNGPWSYTINWGDGRTSTGTVSSEGTVSNGHTYLILLPRTFTITVTVRDAAGASGSDSKKVTVLLL